MQGWINFGSGPLFRFAFVVMLLGIFRLYVLQLTSLNGPYIKTRQLPGIPWHGVQRLWHLRSTTIVSQWKEVPIYSFVATAFHAGVIFVPLYLGAHVILWRQSVGFSWFHLPQEIANILTMVVIVTGPWLFFIRLFVSKWRKQSTLQDYLWLLLLTLPFVSGYIISNSDVTAATYQNLMVLHVYTADLIMIMIPFTKVAQCIFIRILPHENQTTESVTEEVALS
ncbi:hypothetical protein ACFLQV_01380 [Calditrichota bacterium]